MLAKKFRLPAKNMRLGGRSSVSVGHFLVKFIPNSFSYNRFGLIISNKVEKLAAKRHLWRRRFFDEVGLWPNLGLDFLFIAYSKLDELGLPGLKKEISLILDKINKTAKIKN